MTDESQNEQKPASISPASDESEIAGDNVPDEGAQPEDIQPDAQLTDGAAQPADEADVQPAAQPAGAPPTLLFSLPIYRVNKEESGSARIVVDRLGSIEGESRVVYRVTPGTAAPNIHYRDANGTLTFARGVRRQSFTVDLLDQTPGDTVHAIMTLSNPQDAQLGQPHTALLMMMPEAAYNSYHRYPVLGLLSTPTAKRVLRHLFLITILLATVYGVSLSALNTAEARANAWRQYFLPAESQSTPSEHAGSAAPESQLASSERAGSAAPENQLAFNKEANFSEEQKARLTDLLARVQKRINSHWRIMEFYYVRYYMGIITFSFTAALAAILLVLISKRGWEATNEYIITAFFVMTAMSVFFSSWPGVFRQEQNIADNRGFYFKYLALENEILSYATTNEALVYSATINPPQNLLPQSRNAAAADDENDGAEEESPAQPSRFGSPLSANDFIHYVDLQLSQDNIALGFDYNQLPNYNDVFNTSQGK